MSSGIQAQYECGDTVEVTESFTDFPSTTHSITLYLNLNGTPAPNAAGAGSGSNWTFSFSNAVTESMAAGLYDYAYYATRTSDGHREKVKTGQVQFLPNLATAQTPSMAEQQLAALNAVILQLSASGNQSVSFNGQSFTKRDFTQLLDMQRDLQAQVFREKREASNLRGVVNDGHIGTVFPPVGGPYPPFAWPRNCP